MDRRDTLKTLLITGVAGGAVASTVLSSCKTDEPMIAIPEGKLTVGRTPAERERDQTLLDNDFLSAEELSVVATLCDIILPATNSAGSATEADVHNFIDFIIQDIPNLQTPVRGGIAWINNEAATRFNTSFTAATEAQKMEIIEDIAYPDKAAPEMSSGVSFFNRMRDLTMTGYYTTRMGLDDLGYVGNRANIWDGVPEDVLKKHNMSYDPAWLAKCVDQEKREDVATWDEKGNLLS